VGLFSQGRIKPQQTCDIGVDPILSDWLDFVPKLMQRRIGGPSSTHVSLWVCLPKGGWGSNVGFA